VIAGLSTMPKRLPAKWLYDARGADLFEQITRLDDYYLTRSEHELLAKILPAVATRVGAQARVIEPGSGAGVKTRMLLGQLSRVASYVPIDVAEDQLASTATLLRHAFPRLEVLPVLADYATPFEIPLGDRAYKQTVVFFPGSTIGNLEPQDAVRFLARLADLAGTRGWLLLGADTNRDVDQLLRAYDDADGVTAKFNLNVLDHLNREFEANFDRTRFTHCARWNAAESRIEMHLVSDRRHDISIAGRLVRLEASEPIVTEHCYKHTTAAIDVLLWSSGWRTDRVFSDVDQRMRVWLAKRAA
jgi:dimethylhistidine N-methyltransferase